MEVPVGEALVHDGAAVGVDAEGVSVSLRGELGFGVAVDAVCEGC